MLRIVEAFRYRRIWEIIRRRALLLMPLLVLAPGLSDFLYPGSGSLDTDILISHYPNALYLINSIKQWRSIPLWSDSILSGYPFIANPLSGLWYPFGYLAYLLPLPLGFNLLMAIHLIWGGIGLFKLLRSEGVTERAAYFGGVIFTILPKLIAHVGAGHLSLIYAVSWTPWTLFSEKMGVDNRALQKAARYLPGVLIGLVFLADPRWVPYAGGMWVGYLIAHSHSRRCEALFQKILATGLSSLIITAPALLPFIEYILHSTRISLSNVENLIFSLSPANLTGILFPDPRVYHEWITYFGGATFILTISMIVSHLNDRRIAFWSIIFCASLVLATGKYLPLNWLLSDLPGMNLLRVPARALFITGISACALASYGCDCLLNKDLHRLSNRFRMSVFALSVFSTLLLLGIWIVFGSIDWRIAWGLVAITAAGVWINSRIFLPLDNRLWINGMMFIVIIDWGIFARLSYIPHPTENVFRESETVAEYLAHKAVPFRTYSPSYSLPQQTAAKFDLQLSDGVDPLQLSSYVAFMISASGVPRSGYSVTLPEFSKGDPKTDNQKFNPDPVLLGRLNVAYILSEFDLMSDAFVLETRFRNTRVYKNLKAMPRAWMQPNLHEMSEAVWEVESIDWQPNQIEITAEGPGYLILSEIAYPGWKVWVDGQHGQLLKPYGLLRGVYLDPGRHQVYFRYQPNSLYLGISLSIVCLIGLLGCLASDFRKYRNQRGNS